MPSKTAGKRDNSYYLRRLELEKPTFYRDYLAGKFKSAAAAFRAAGLRRPRSRLSELKNAWNKAMPAEQRDFLLWLGVKKPSSAASVIDSGPITTGQTLGEEVKRRVEAILSSRSIKVGQAMKEMGFNALNPSLGMALHRGTCVQPDLLIALDKWIKDNSPDSET